MVKINKNIFKLIICVLPIIIGWIIYNFSFFPSIIRNYLPDFCWAISLYFTLYFMRVYNGQLVVIFMISSFLSFTYEIGQRLNYFDGTFDVLDLITYHLAFVLAIISIKFSKK